ncbi:MAG: hypothetical protein FWC41_01145 [Firmicutes bacterium]|nr:hypothetical protein [Bacillota bacterium]
MRKRGFILIIVVLVSAISNSCKKSCICYMNVPAPAVLRSMTDVTTREECAKLLETELGRDTIYTRCEWEKW